MTAQLPRRTRPLRSSGLLPVAVFALSTVGCSDDAQQRLATALSQVGIRDVVVNDQNIEATCSQGDKLTVPTAELERNFLGLSNAKKVVAIAKNIAKDCDEKDGVKKREEAQRLRLAETLKALAIDGTGLDEAAQKKAICDKLTEQLPRKEPDRIQAAAKNTREWSCPPAPPAAALPTGLWEVTVGKPDGKKAVMNYARLANEDGDKLTMRCSVAGKVAKPEIYVQLAAKTKVKKGTKVIMASLDGKKPDKWKANVAKDLSAMFFEPKAALRPLANAQKLSVTVPTSKKPARVDFEVRGFGEALRQLPPGCR